MEPVELGIFVAGLTLIIQGVAFYKFRSMTEREGRKIIWRTYLPLENHKIEEICVLLCLDYEKILKTKEDYIEREKLFKLEGNLSFLGKHADIKSAEEASNLLNILSGKENLLFKFFMAVSSLLTFTIFFLGFIVIKG